MNHQQEQIAILNTTGAFAQLQTEVEKLRIQNASMKAVIEDHNKDIAEIKGIVQKTMNLLRIDPARPPKNLQGFLMKAAPQIIGSSLLPGNKQKFDFFTKLVPIIEKYK